MQDSARPDPMPHFIEVARAIREPGQPVTALAALDKALEGAIGHRLFTVLAVNLEKNENRRYYSNRPREYPVGGVKPIVQDSPITHKVMLDEICYIIHDYAQLSRVFFDHELIRSLGCESSINVPVRWNRRTVGMLNLLHRSGWYRDEGHPNPVHFRRVGDSRPPGDHRRAKVNSGHVAGRGQSASKRGSSAFLIVIESDVQDGAEIGLRVQAALSTR